jgi:hypothetical protein
VQNNLKLSNREGRSSQIALFSEGPETMSNEIKLQASTEENEPTPAETLELLKAFNRIRDPQLKRAIVTLAQQLAMGSSRYTQTLIQLLRMH